MCGVPGVLCRAAAADRIPRGWRKKDGMKFEMARESCRKPCLNGEGRSLRQCIFDVVACFGDGISIIIASKFICLRIEIARRGVAARAEDAHAPPEDIQGCHVLRRRGDCSQAVLSLTAAAAAVAACKRAKCPRSAADDHRCIKRMLIVRPCRG